MKRRHAARDTARATHAFTLIELMIVVSISAIVAAGLGALFVDVHAQQRFEHAGTLQPLVGQSVLTSLRCDLRAARDVALTTRAGVTILTIRPHQPTRAAVVYTLRDGWLERQSAGQRVPLARATRFVVRRRARLLEVELELSRRLGRLRRQLSLQVALAVGLGGSR